MTHLGQSSTRLPKSGGYEKPKFTQAERFRRGFSLTKMFVVGHVVWSIRQGSVGEFDAPEILGGYRSASRIHEPRLGEVLRLPDGSGPWRVIDWRVTRRSDSPKNVLVVQRLAS
jgi:hypothetical protein